MPCLAEMSQIFNTIQVLLYNFFKDSTANVNQWRVVRRGNSDETHDIPAPDFDETKHASICTEVSLSFPPRPTVTKLRDIVEVSLCCHHTCPEESLVFGQLRERRTNEGARPINPFLQLLTTFSRLIGATEIKSKSGGQLLRFLV